MASTPLLASAAGQLSVTSSERASSPGWRRSIMPMTMRAMRAAMRRRSCGASGLPSASSMPRALATTSTGGSMRVRPLSSSSTRRRPPTAMAQVARMRPFSISANLVVPPPISTLSSGRIVTARERDGAGAVGRHLAFHMVAGRGTDELCRLRPKTVRRSRARCGA